MRSLHVILKCEHDGMNLLSC